MTAIRKTKRLHVLPGGKGDLPSVGSSIKPQQSEQYEVLFENANDAIMVVSLDSGTITNVNTSAQELTGYQREELVGQKLEILSPPATTVDRFSQLLSLQHIENNGFFEDIVLISKDGYSRFVSLSAKTATLAQERVALCIFRDVGEKKRMERDLITKHSELRNAYVELEKANANLKSMQESLVQSGKLAALGELAAGIAHELNQPLTAIKGFAQEAASTIKQGDTTTASSYLDEIVRGADKMEKIISHLRNFTRKSTEDFKWMDVHLVINESLLMLDKQLKTRGIVVKKNYLSTLPKVYCNPFQLEQVFINLATNARDAIEAKHEAKGVISIETRKANDHLIEVVYSDNGCGIPDAAKGKIFNPFFTTKEVGRGMGLGLSISYGILSRIQASIVVESTLGQGTVFTIKIPVDYRQH